jgi:hypothetical protein
MGLTLVATDVSRVSIYPLLLCHALLVQDRKVQHAREDLFGFLPVLHRRTDTALPMSSL